MLAQANQAPQIGAFAAPLVSGQAVVVTGAGVPEGAPVLVLGCSNRRAPGRARAGAGRGRAAWSGTPSLPAASSRCSWSWVTSAVTTITGMSRRRGRRRAARRARVGRRVRQVQVEHDHVRRAGGGPAPGRRRRGRRRAARGRRGGDRGGRRARRCPRCPRCRGRGRGARRPSARPLRGRRAWRRDVRLPSPASGSSTVNVLPAGPLSTVSVPPIAWTRLRDSGRPRPVPSTSRARAQPLERHERALEPGQPGCPGRCRSRGCAHAVSSARSATTVTSAPLRAVLDRVGESG